jgi:hypothetical protein
MKRVLAGMFLAAHGLAHAAVGVWATTAEPVWMVTILLAIAVVGFLAAGLGLLGVWPARTRWFEFLAVATVASLVLMLVHGQTVFLPGAALDVVILFVAWRVHHNAPLRRDAVPGTARPLRRAVSGIAHGVGTAVIVYAGIVTLFRPAAMRWGTTATDRRTPLLGDERVTAPHYRIDHAITIHAPADSVWPWLVQLGQDRGGFYSYAWLERLIGDDIHNADRIVPAWQHLERGDLVRSVQPGFLGGLGGDSLGWRVEDIQQGRAFHLRNWGTFALVPVDANTTRLYVRTLGEGAPAWWSTLAAPISMFVFEPAHFIMERGMLRGVRDRAEGRRRASN